MDLFEMSAQEIMTLSDLAKLAREAKEASQLIAKSFKTAFGIGKMEIQVFHTESCGEYYGDGYLSIDGVFKYHDNWWGGRTYEFRCDTEGIYKMLRSSYLKSRGMSEVDPEEFDCEIENMDNYFRKFISNLKSKA